MCQGGKGTVDCADDTEKQNNDAGIAEGVRGHLQGEPHQPVCAELQHDTRQDDATNGRCLNVGRRQPGMQRYRRNLDREGNQHGDQRPHGRRPLQRRIGNPRPHIEGGVGTAEVKPQNCEQQWQAAQQGVDKEHQGGPLPVFMSPSGNHEIHRHQGNFEEDVEQNAVQGGKGTDCRGFQKQDQSYVGTRTVAKRRRIDQRNQEKHGTQQHQRQADAINPDPVGGANGRHPYQLFDLGKAVTTHALKPHGQSADQGQGGTDDRYAVHRPRRRLRQTQNQHSADEWQKQGQGYKW